MLSSVYLLQCGVRDAIAGQAKVSHSEIKLVEECGKGPVSGSTVGQDEGDLLTDALQKRSFWYMAAHKLSYSSKTCFNR